MILNKSSDNNVLLVHNTRFWAERGLIHHENKETGEYGSLSVRTFLQHIKGISDMLGGSSPRSDHVKDAALRKEYADIIERSTEICRRAQVQGMPSDASARRDLARRRAKTICVSAGKSYM